MSNRCQFDRPRERADDLRITGQRPLCKTQKSARSRFGQFCAIVWVWFYLRWLREQDLNLRPSGYEPDELPGCSIPRHQHCAVYEAGPLGAKKPPVVTDQGGYFDGCEWVFQSYAPASMPGDALLFQRLSGSTIGAVRFHVRVRDGIGWGTDAMATKQ